MGDALRRPGGQVVGDHSGQSLAGHQREFGVHSEWGGRPLNDFKQESVRTGVEENAALFGQAKTYSFSILHCDGLYFVTL